MADLSLPDVDASTYPRRRKLTTDVTYTANVRTADNVTKKTLVLTFQRVVLKDAAGKINEGKWMITGLKDAGAAK